MKKLLCITAIALSLGATQVYADAAAGKTKSEGCTGCHGRDGRSTMPTNPSLAGQQEAYLVKALKDYRDGKRSDPMMGTFAKTLSDADIADLAAFYASVK